MLSQAILNNLCIIISIILGAIVGQFLFIKYNVDYHGPNSAHVKNKIHKKNGKCYIFEPTMYLCPVL